MNFLITFDFFRVKNKKFKIQRSKIDKSINFGHFLAQTFSSIFKTVGVTALTVNPFMWPKFGEHENHVDVIFRRPIIGRVTIFYVEWMCRMDVREETAEIVTIRQLFREISRE